MVYLVLKYSFVNNHHGYCGENRPFRQLGMDTGRTLWNCRQVMVPLTRMTVANVISSQQEEDNSAALG